MLCDERQHFLGVVFLTWRKSKRDGTGMVAYIPITSACGVSILHGRVAFVYLCMCVYAVWAHTLLPYSTMVRTTVHSILRMCMPWYLRSAIFG